MAILITDGSSSTDSTAVVAEATTAHQAGIKILSVGAGISVNATELQLIASLPRLFYHQWWLTLNLADLSWIEPLIARTLCRPEYGTQYTLYLNLVTYFVLLCHHFFLVTI